LNLHKTCAVKLDDLVSPHLKICCAPTIYHCRITTENPW